MGTRGSGWPCSGRCAAPSSTPIRTWWSTATSSRRTCWWTAHGVAEAARLRHRQAARLRRRSRPGAHRHRAPDDDARVREPGAGQGPDGHDRQRRLLAGRPSLRAAGGPAPLRSADRLARGDRAGRLPDGARAPSEVRHRALPSCAATWTRSSSRRCARSPSGVIGRPTSCRRTSGATSKGFRSRPGRTRSATAPASSCAGTAPRWPRRSWCRPASWAGSWPPRGRPAWRSGASTRPAGSSTRSSSTSSRRWARSPAPRRSARTSSRARSSTWRPWLATPATTRRSSGSWPRPTCSSPASRASRARPTWGTSRPPAGRWGRRRSSSSGC